MPFMHHFSFLVRYLIIVMLFLVLLKVKFSREAYHPSHWTLLGANLVMGPLAYWAVQLAGGDHNLALAAFFAGITPTATAAPVIMGFLGGKVEYVIGGFLLISAFVALAMPWLMPFFIGVDTPGITLSIFGNLCIVIGLPMIVALAVRKVRPALAEKLVGAGDFSFGLWLASLFLIAANASEFIHRNPMGGGLWLYLGVTALVCAVNFAIGYVIVPKNFRREGSQTLGQKNTTLTIYLALTYANPLVALGPTCYVLWHNLWNAYQLSKVKRDGTVKTAESR